MEKNNAADFVAFFALLTAVISLSMNFHQWHENRRLSALSQEQFIRIDSMERTLLMGQ